MFLASLSFMLAYAVGIVRYKLMLVDQIVSKGVLYYAVSSGLTLMFGLTVAAGVLRGLQDTRVPMWIAVFSYWVPGFGMSLAFGFATALAGVASHPGRAA